MPQPVGATAPGKVILFGEHAVVYGRPAIAIPVTQVRATAVVEPYAERGVRLVAPDLARDIHLSDVGEEDPLAAALYQVCQATGLRQLPDMLITVTSQIPIASGLGSGAAIAAATIRAVAGYLGFSQLATNDWVSSLTYEVEKIHHGTPSGIDNTVVTYEKPVYFVRQQPQNRIETFRVAEPLHLLIADTGIRSSTKEVVGDVRRQWQANPTAFESLFDECGRIAEAARLAIEAGRLQEIGRLMIANQALLEKMTVSGAELEKLVRAAMQAGALGGKLSGAGRGGNMIALVSRDTAADVRQALLAGGARRVLTSIVSS
jgi:mevalonate kinase